MWLHSSNMKMNLSAVLLALVIVSAGCVKTVNDRTTGGVPFVKDRVEAK